MIKLKSPAKLNLYLRILNSRRDGYHDIVTLFERIGLFDEITLTAKKAGGIKVACDNKAVPVDETNLCFKAARALLDYTGKKRSALIKLKKRIPVSAGLAGGSGDAATTLLGLNRLWRLELSKKELMGLGAKIGSDVNFFLLNKSLAIGTGTGSSLKPLAMKKALWHIIVMPKYGLSTKVIYKYWDKGCQRGELGKIALTQALADVKILLHSIRRGNLTLLAKSLHNDLERPAHAKLKEILTIKEYLKSCKVSCVLMSGSGPCVFGIMASKKQAAGIKLKLSRLKKDWRIFIVKTY